MVTINGLSRNMGHDMLADNEETYRELVDIIVVNREQFVNVLKIECRKYNHYNHYNYCKQWKRETWLRLMGLIETWDMTC